MNVLVKYADDTNLLVPSDSDLDLSTEFDKLNSGPWRIEWLSTFSRPKKVF